MAFNVFKKNFSWLDILDNNSIVKEWKFTLKFWKRKKTTKNITKNETRVETDLKRLGMGEIELNSTREK